ncbi:hypothetical protein K438DRAFT_1491283, partial [Mycena galopus ATCC 62051]
LSLHAFGYLHCALAPRDIFYPTMLSPTVATVWTINHKQNVTWYVPFVPADLT